MVEAKTEILVAEITDPKPVTVEEDTDAKFTCKYSVFKKDPVVQWYKVAIGDKNTEISDGM